LAKKKRFQSAALRCASDRYIGADKAKVAPFQEEFTNGEIASQIYQLRTNSGPSQRQLAARVGTTASVICRLEDADNAGHSLSMLRRIAAAMNKRIEIRFVEANSPHSA
jgi:ribosome-binding protein aMBF1 (putative translation factor)